MSFKKQREHYYHEHQSLGCRITHMFGVPMLLAAFIMLLVSPFWFYWQWFAGLLLGGIALQLVGHFVFESNHPVFFSDPKNPFTYFSAIIFVGEEWLHALRRGWRFLGRCFFG